MTLRSGVFGQGGAVGARAYLQGAWRRRDLVLLFSSGDAPHGFADGVAAK
jgi:hypothetical protein